MGQMSVLSSKKPPLVHRIPKGHFPQEKAVVIFLGRYVNVASSMTKKPILGGISVKIMPYLIN